MHTLNVPYIFFYLRVSTAELRKSAQQGSRENTRSLLLRANVAFSSTRYELGVHTGILSENRPRVILGEEKKSNIRFFVGAVLLWISLPRRSPSVISIDASLEQRNIFELHGNRIWINEHIRYSWFALFIWFAMNIVSVYSTVRQTEWVTSWV